MSIDDTPLMRQYLEVKQQHPDCIVFFRLGDFYEMFFDDAVVAARALDLVLTSRDKNKENPVPMCGVPHHSAHPHINRLIELGHKVAICEQVEDPKEARGIVRREVVRIVTPGVLIEEEQLSAKQSNYLCAVLFAEEDIGLSLCDVSTGEFAATILPRRDLEDELGRLRPRELLLPDGAPIDAAAIRQRFSLTLSTLSSALLGEVESRQLLASLGVEVGKLPALALAAAAALIAYAKSTQPRGALPLLRLRPYHPSELLSMDDASRCNLELDRTIQDGTKRGSLLAVLDVSATAMGGRMLRRWLAGPLTDLARIRRRHDAVEWLVEHPGLRTQLIAALKDLYDIERLAGRARLGVATPRDLAYLGRSLHRLAVLAELLSEGKRLSESKLAYPQLLDLGADLASDVAQRITTTLMDDPPGKWQEGAFIRPGFSTQLDELSGLSEGGKTRLAEIELRERERTGIGSLKIRFNRVFGYFIEITNTHRERVPADYVRKQTLANAERYVTSELAEYEAKILSADDKRLKLELAAFEALREATAAEAGRVLRLAERIAAIDVLCALAQVAHSHGYVRPELDDSLVLDLRDARHPVVEQLAAAGKFVPNDVHLSAESADSDQLLLVTGPNMAGKSTVMRQTALCVVLAQMGSFVPAARARIGLCDRLFVRVGASDNLGRGESTFMVEMRETANILAHATRRSLVILDEIGRGTATYDGLSIAWAVTEHLHDQIGARTMFATHYHELCQLTEDHPRVQNFSTAVREWQGQIVFLHKLVPGPASRSYGIEVARLAGLPPYVIARAQTILNGLERGDSAQKVAAEPRHQLRLVDSAPPPPRLSTIELAIRDADLDGMSPRQAAALLAELQARLR